MFLNEVQVPLKLFLSLGHFGFVLVVFLELRDVLLESLIVGVIFLRCLKECAAWALLLRVVCETTDCPQCGERCYYFQ
jgi:hypothetical protein